MLLHSRTVLVPNSAINGIALEGSSSSLHAHLSCKMQDPDGQDSHKLGLAMLYIFL